MNTNEPASLTRTDRDEPLAARWETVVHAFAERRAVRAARRSMEQELSSYTTAAELHELDAMLERYRPEDVQDVVQIVERIRLRAA